MLCFQLTELVSKALSSNMTLFLVQFLTSSPSSVQFDRLTNTKTVATLIHKVLWSLWSISKRLREPILNSTIMNDVHCDIHCDIRGAIKKFCNSI